MTTQPKFITSPSYDSLHQAALTICREARTMDWIDAVVAPVRGGLLFGVVASHKLNVPLYAVSYSSKSGAGDDKNHANELYELPPTVKVILLVDDIADSGLTMQEIRKFYTDRGVKVITAVFHWKMNAQYKPDLYYWSIPHDSEFIQFPYENT